MLFLQPGKHLQQDFLGHFLSSFWSLFKCSLPREAVVRIAGVGGGAHLDSETEDHAFLKIAPEIFTMLTSHSLIVWW